MSVHEPKKHKRSDAAAITPSPLTERSPAGPMQDAVVQRVPAPTQSEAVDAEAERAPEVGAVAGHDFSRIGILGPSSAPVASGGDDPASAVRRATDAGAGVPLAHDLKSRFEQALGADLSNVRLHTSSESATAADRLQARAFTMGPDIHFGAGAYDPGSVPGRGLIAHETAHTVQQTQGGIARAAVANDRLATGSLSIVPPGHRSEVEAQQFAESFERGVPTRVNPIIGGISRAVIQRDPLTAPPAKPNDIEFPDVDTDKASDQAAASSADSSRQAALKNAPVFQINNVEDRTSAQEAINLLKKAEPTMRLGAQQALNAGKTALNPGNTEKDDFEGYLKDNNLALGALEGFLGSAQTQAVALSTFQLLHQQTIAEFGRLDGKMKALLGSSLASPDDGRAADRMGKEDAQALAGGNDLTKAFEEAKTRDPKLADAIKGLENQRQQMEIEADGLSTDSNNVTNKFRGITTGLAKVSSAAAQMSSVELSGEAEAFKEKAEQKKAQVEVVVGAVVEGIKGLREGPAAAGKAVAGKLAGGVWDQIVKPKLGAWLQGGDKLFGAFPTNLDSLAKTDQEKAAVGALRAAQAQVADSNRDLQTAVEQLEQKVRKVLVTKQAYGDAMRDMGDRIDKLGGNKGGHAFREVMGLIAEGERFVTQAGETIQVGEQELTQTERAGQGGAVKSAAKEAHDQSTAINEGGGMRVWMPFEFQVTDVEIKGGQAVEKPRLGPDGQPVKLIRASRSSIKVLTAQNKAENFQDVSKFGSAESGRDAAGNANAGVNATVAVTLDQVKDMKGKVADYVTALRVNSIGGGGAANPNN